MSYKTSIPLTLPGLWLASVSELAVTIAGRDACPQLGVDNHHK